MGTRLRSTSGSERIAKIEGGTLIYYHPDHLSVRALSDATGKIGDRGHFPFGETWYENGVGTKFKLTEKERDSESQLDYFGARYLTSSTGRFTSADEPLLDQWQDAPQSWNLFSFVRNNPINSFDPSGNECVTFDNGTVGDDGNGKACDHMTQGSGEADATVNAKPPTVIEDVVDDTTWFVNYAGEQVFGTWLGAFDQATRTRNAIIGTLALASMIVPIKGEAGSSEIRITEEALAKITRKHLINTAEKSAFNLGEDVVQLVKAAERVQATARPSSGNLVRIVDAGRPVGIDKATGQLTNVYTVVTRSNGDLITIHPGRPSW